jgi:hypothetical protein
MPASIQALSKMSQCRVQGALTLEEERRLVRDQVSGEVLSSVDETGDDRPPQIGASDEVQEGGITTHLSLDFHGSLNHGKSLMRILLGFAAQSLDRAQGFLATPVSDKPPGRLGCQEYEDQQGSLRMISLAPMR